MFLIIRVPASQNGHLLRWCDSASGFHSCATSGTVIDPPDVSWLIGEDQAYTVGFTVVGVIALVGLILPILARPPKHA